METDVKAKEVNPNGGLMRKTKKDLVEIILRKDAEYAKINSNHKALIKDMEGTCLELEKTRKDYAGIKTTYEECCERLNNKTNAYNYIADKYEILQNDYQAMNDQYATEICEEQCKSKKYKRKANILFALVIAYIIFDIMRYCF